ncbi:hypothetical protein MMC26_005891 [Xylographa opegraphella]|nr:hypothetical protein [Xylographa opegraphella]
MSSPPRLRRSPKRRALHERSDSHANEVTAPSLRVVGDSDAKIYASTPFPTHESQILSPRGRKLFEHDVSVSSASQPTAATPQAPRTSDPISRPDHGRRQSSAHNGSDSELPQTATESPSSHFEKEPPQTFESPSNVGVDRLDMDGDIVHDERASDEIVQLPSVYGSRDGRDRSLTSIPNTPSNDHRASLRAIASVASQLSLDSAGSSDTVVRRSVRGPPPRGSYALFPGQSRPGSSRSTRSLPTPPRLLEPEPEPDAKRVSLSPVSSTSPTSPVSPLSPSSIDFPTPPQRVYESPTYAPSSTVIGHSPPALQYPVIRAPTASRSYAGSSYKIPRRPVGMSERSAEEQRNSHLSTIHSEGTDERSSGSDEARQQRVTSVTSSLAVDGSSISSYYPPVPPLVAFTRSRDVTNSTIRVVNEEGDNISDLPSPVLGGQTSSFFNLPSAERTQSRNSHYSMTRTGAGSRGSFLRDSIPAWARYFHRHGNRQRALNMYDNANTDSNQRIYYAQEGRNLRPVTASEPTESSRPPTHESQNSFPYGIFRSRTRPREINTASSNRDSMGITSIPNPEVVVEIHGSPRRKISPSWSPHLWHDRRSAADRRTIFIAPSLDESAEGAALTRRNVQIWLFVLGFIFAPAWMIAAFLPLPRPPQATPPASPNGPNIAHDIEKALGPFDQARYENARYWRIMNRFMSVIGILIIVAIIILAVVGSRRSA